MGISIWQILLIVLVVVLLFGAGKLPRLMGDFAKGIKSFKTGMREGEHPPSASTTQAAEPTAETKALDKDASTVEATVVKKDEAAKSQG